MNGLKKKTKIFYVNFPKKKQKKEIKYLKNISRTFHRNSEEGWHRGRERE